MLQARNAMSAHQNETSPPSDSVEEIPTEPTERKRVLNVLAQRRYRRRKKQRQAMLETLVGQHASPGASASHASPGTAQIQTTPAHVTTGFVVPDVPSLSLSAQPSLDQTALSALTPPWDDSLDSWLQLSLDSSSNSNSGASPSHATSLLSEFLQEDDIEHATFSDDFQIAVTELGLLRAGFENALQLRSAERLWDLQANSVFLDSDTSSWALALPQNLQPTQKQLAHPHHPIIDILPWPSVRNKLIEVYTLPPDFWPKHPEDGEACSLIRLVYDMEDGGVRVWGADPAAQEAWEVNDAFAKAWWWMLDPAVLQHSNQRRMARGEQPLGRIEAWKS